MLDIKFIRENKEKIKLAVKNKNIALDLDKLLELDALKRGLDAKIDELRAARNQLAQSSPKGKPSEEQIAQGKKYKEQIAELELKLTEINERYVELMVKVPNVPSDDTPVGRDENDNVEIYKWGKPTKFKFNPKSHIELAEELDLIE